MNLDGTELGNVLITKLLSLKSNPVFYTLLSVVGTERLQTSFLFGHLAPCRGWTKGGGWWGGWRGGPQEVYEAGGGRRAYSLLFASCSCQCSHGNGSSPGSVLVSSFQSWFSVFLFFSYSQNCPHCTASEIPAPAHRCPFFRGLASSLMRPLP